MTERRSSRAGDGPILQASLCKATAVYDYYCRRRVCLYADRFETFNSVDEAPTTYWLSPGCRLSPGSKADLKLKRKHIRPKGVGSMTALAALRGKGEVLDLWTFKLDGDEYFGFGFEDQQEACTWHDALSQVIAALRAAAGLPQASPDKHSRLGGGRDSAAADAPLDGGRSSASSAGGVAPRASLLAGEPAAMQLPVPEPAGAAAQDEEAELARLLDFPRSGTQRVQQRWVPYRHSNGLAIYQHQQTGRPTEYLVSAVVRGSPSDVLRALLDPGSATTILGPALEVEVLDSQPGKQVLRILLQAVGPTAAWFRPREAVVTRLLRKEEDGVFVVLFSHTAAFDAQTALRREGVLEVAEGMPAAVRRHNPIRARVNGGYTVSKLRGYAGAASPETLLTCVLQVEDMGGWLNQAHPLFRLVDWWSGSAYTAFLERMLLGVMLVRDVVENSRFAVHPPVAAFADDSGDEAVGAALSGAASCVSPFAAEAEAGKVPALRTSTFVLRQAAGELLGHSGAADAAARAAPGSEASPFASSAAALASSGRSIMLGPGQRLSGLAPKTSRLASARLGSTGTPARLASSGLLPGEALVEAEEQPPFQLPQQYYQELHTPGHEHPFKVRGANYLSDGVKVGAGAPMFELLGMEVVNTGGAGPMPHICRFLSSIRRSPKPFMFVFNLVVPGPPTVCCVFVFASDQHPDALGQPPDDPEDSTWSGFDHLLWRFLKGDDDERASLLKMIPRIAEGSWVVRQSVGTTPVLIGRKLTTSFHVTPKYVEVAVDVGSSTIAQHVTGMVRGGCRSLVIDLGLTLEGQHPWELPEVLLGAVRVSKLDLAAASKLDSSAEVPLLLPSPPEAA